MHPPPPQALLHFLSALEVFPPSNLVGPFIFFYHLLPKPQVPGVSKDFDVPFPFFHLHNFFYLGLLLRVTHIFLPSLFIIFYLAVVFAFLAIAHRQFGTSDRVFATSEVVLTRPSYQFFACFCSEEQRKS